MDYFDSMRKATSVDDKLEIYLLAEPIFDENMLKSLVKLSNSKEVAECYKEKIEQEQDLLTAVKVPLRYKNIALKNRQTKSNKTLCGKTTQEDWD